MSNTGATHFFANHQLKEPFRPLKGQTVLACDVDHDSHYYHWWGTVENSKAQWIVLCHGCFEKCDADVLKAQLKHSFVIENVTF